MSEIQYRCTTGAIIIIARAAMRELKRVTALLCEKNTVRTLLATVALVPFFASSALAQNHSFKVLHTFEGENDGAAPVAGLTSDKAGNLYGTTSSGGCSGTAFKLAPDGTETVLHCFEGGADGGGPYGRLIRDEAGTLYGTTAYGGAKNAGTIFEIDTTGTETVLYSFRGRNDGDSPLAGMIRIKGIFYGTAAGGGATSNGVVFELARDGRERVVHAFAGGQDGAIPEGDLIADISGNLYGTTSSGGIDDDGTVFKIAPDGTETVLYAFTGSDGSVPLGALIFDKEGNLYGTTNLGGAYNSGTIFEFTSTGVEKVLYSFSGGSDGGFPSCTLFQDGGGNLFGTAEAGGSGANGVIFKLASSGSEAVLHTFSGGDDGGRPYAGLIKNSADEKGFLYGTTRGGGTGDGVVFSIKK